jgi:hypothetical protein
VAPPSGASHLHRKPAGRVVLAGVGGVSLRFDCDSALLPHIVNRIAVNSRRCGCQPSIPIAQLALPEWRPAFGYTPDDDAGQISATCRRAFDPVWQGQSSISTICTLAIGATLSPLASGASREFIASRMQGYAPPSESHRTPRQPVQADAWWVVTNIDAYRR